jgi:heptosyltransferase-2
LLESSLSIDRLVPFRSRRELLASSLSMRENGLTAGVVFPDSLSSAFFLYLTGARRRIGYSGGVRGIFLTETIRPPENRRSEHLVETYFRLARSVNPDALLSHPELKIDSETVPGLLGVAPGATYGPAKRWMMDRFVELIGRAVRECGCRVQVFGGPLEVPVAPHLDRDTRSRVEDFTGRASLRETASLMARCQVVVTNDTGLMHLACAVGTPVIALFGSTNPSWTGPLGQHNSIIRKEIDCSPCYRRTCPRGAYECFEQISVAEVLDSIRTYLSR